MKLSQGLYCVADMQIQNQLLCQPSVMKVGVPILFMRALFQMKDRDEDNSVIYYLLSCEGVKMFWKYRSTIWWYGQRPQEQLYQPENLIAFSRMSKCIMESAPLDYEISYKTYTKIFPFSWSNLPLLV